MNQATNTDTNTVKQIFDKSTKTRIIKNVINLKSDSAQRLQFPIDKIDDIKVLCTVKKVHNTNIVFTIESLNVYKEVPREIISYDEDDYDDNYDDTPDYNIEHANLYHYNIELNTTGDNHNKIIKFFEDITVNIQNLKLCKITSKFIIKTDDQDETEFNKAIYESIEDKTNIECTIKECPVCMDLTNNKTFCNHFLCIQCWDKMPKKRNDIKCPMCRASIISK